LELKDVNISATLASIKQQLGDEKSLSPAFRSAIELLVLIVTLLVNRLGLDSKNSSKPPSTDPHRKRKEKKPGDKKPGGQPGHIGSTLKRVEEPDVIEKIEIDRRFLPRNVKYNDVGFEWRQVIDIEFKTVVTEYQAQVLEDENGKRYTASFPVDVTRPIQYGASLKAHAVYLSQFQLIPFQRIQDHFSDQWRIDLSVGSLCNFNVQVYELLERFDEIGANRLAESKQMHADETSVNINGKRIWLHTASNDKWTHFRVHANRGTLATNEIGKASCATITTSPISPTHACTHCATRTTCANSSAHGSKTNTAGRNACRPCSMKSISPSMQRGASSRMPPQKTIEESIEKS